MMKNKNFSFKKLFSNKRFSVIFSVVVAFVFWLAITIDQTEVINKSFANISVNITTEGSFAGDMGLEVIKIENEKNATVTAYGPNSSVSAIEVSDILITADLSEVTGAGSYTIPLSVTTTSKKTGVTFDVSPKTLNITFDFVDTKEFEVVPVAKEIALNSKLNTSFFKGEPVINSAEFTKIVVKGPRADMKLLNRVEAVVTSSDNIKESKTYEAGIVLYDESGKILDNSKYTLPFETVKVTVPVYKERTVSIVPTFSNEDVKGEGNSKLKGMSLSKVTVYGLPDIVDDLDNIKLTPIDYREYKAGKLIFETKLLIPDGIYLKKEVGNITVTLN
jgi:YbbR domain-containing protein